jgi:non-specific serine/threonine protein kinase
MIVEWFVQRDLAARNRRPDRPVRGIGDGQTYRARRNAPVHGEVIRHPAAFLASAAPSGRRDNLPIEVTSFVGRAQETATVRGLLIGARLLTLTGVGGVGKTRLALRTVAGLRRTYPEGVWLVELGGLTSGDSVAGHVAYALGVGSGAGVSARAALREFVAGKRMLVILDSCEHVLDECAALTGLLLASGESVNLLCTSRQPLGIGGEHLYNVPTLAVPDLATTPQLRPGAHDDAVALFAERASAILPGFTVTEDNYVSVVRLCQELDGIPLAIELAAARLRAFSVEQILDRLDDRYRLLTEGNRMALPRQRTLRALVDWSFGLCTAAEKAMWARLSVFRDGFELAAAAAVCGPDRDGEDVVDLVAGLVEKSLVVRSEWHGRVRYRMLETIRRYGYDRLAESAESRELRRRHRDWFVKLAKLAESGWSGPKQIELARRIGCESANLRAALEFCLTEPGELQQALELVAVLCDQRRSCASLDEARHWLDRVLKLATDRTAARARTLVAAGWITLLQGDQAVAKAMLRECHDLAEQLGETRTQALAIQFGGLAELFAGNFGTAAKLLTQALDLHRESGDVGGVQLATGQLVMTQAFAGDPAAEHGIETCLGRIDPAVAPEPYAYVLWYRSVARWRQHDFTSAAEYARRALGVERVRGDQLLLAFCLETLAWTEASLNAFALAARLLGASDRLRREIGMDLSGLRHLAVPHAGCEQRIVSGLGEEGFRREFLTGRGLTVEEAVATACRTYVVGVPLPRGESRPAPGPVRPQLSAIASAPLTPRQFEVAALVERGLSNREIAAELVIALRTAETHVEHILSKLGFSRRSQIAVWSSAQRR